MLVLGETMIFLLATILAIADPVGSSKHPQAVVGLAVSPAGDQLASLSPDGVVLIWDLKTSHELRRWNVSRLAVTIAWPQSDRLIAVGAIAVDVLDPTTGKSVLRHEVGQRTDAAAVSPDGRFVAAANTHFVGRLIDVATGKPLCPFPAPEESTYAMAVSPDSALLALTSRNPDPETITLLETRTFSSVRHWPTGLTDAVGLCFSPDGQLLASAGEGNEIKLWALTGGDAKRIFTMALPGAVALDFSRNSRRLAVGCGVPVPPLRPNSYAQSLTETISRVQSRPLIQCFDVATGKEVWSSPTLKSWVTSIRFLPDGRLVTGHNDGTVRFWDQPQ